MYLKAELENSRIYMGEYVIKIQGVQVLSRLTQKPQNRPLDLKLFHFVPRF